MGGCCLSAFLSFVICQDETIDPNDTFQQTNDVNLFRSQSEDQDISFPPPPQEEQPLDPFRAPTSTTPFPTTTSQRRRNEENPFGNRLSFDNLGPRPQVDEFGNPLEDIHSVDTTRFELGDRFDISGVQCPKNWVRYRDSCYKFTRSPIKRWDDARLQCQAYRHKDEVRRVQSLFFEHLIKGHAENPFNSIPFLSPA